MKDISDSPKSHTVLTGRYFLFKLGICLEMGKEAEGRQLIDELTAVHPDLKARMKLADQFWLSYVAAYFLFSIGAYEEAGQWLRQMFDGPRTPIRVDLQCYARLLQLTILYESGEYDLLATNLKNTARFIYKHERMYHFEKQLLKCLRKLANTAPDSKRLSHFWKEHLLAFQELKKEKFEAIGFFWLDVTSWLESKIKGNYLAEIKKEHFLAKASPAHSRSSNTSSIPPPGR